MSLLLESSLSSPLSEFTPQHFLSMCSGPGEALNMKCWGGMLSAVQELTIRPGFVTLTAFNFGFQHHLMCVIGQPLPLAQCPAQSKLSGVRWMDARKVQTKYSHSGKEGGRTAQRPRTMSSGSCRAEGIPQAGWRLAFA